MRRCMTVSIVLLCAGASHAQEKVASANWTQWRGPNRDGAVHGVALPRRWPDSLTEVWRVPAGSGVASPLVVDGAVYLFLRQKDSEFVRCLELQSGKQIWESEPYAAPFQPGPGDAFSNGPRSTPAFAAGRLFALGISGILSCLDAATGRLLWRKDYQPYYNRSGNSPLVADGVCIAHMGTGKTGGIRAFDAATGDVKWCFDHDSPAPASPILVDLGGQRQVVTFTARELLGVSFASGKVLWRTRCSHDYFENCVTPVAWRDLLIAPGRMEPPRAFRLVQSERGMTAQEVWQAKGCPAYMSTPVAAGAWLFGHSDHKKGQLYCLDAATGATLWEGGERLGSYATIVNAGTHWLVLSNNGRLLVVKASGKAYEPVAEYKVSAQQMSPYPVFLGERLLIRDDTTLSLFRIDGGAP